MTNTPRPLATRVAHTAALVQAVLLTGTTAFWGISLAISERYERSPAIRSDPQYSKNLALDVWGTLIIVTLVALMLVAVPAWGLRRDMRSARGWLVAGEIVTLAPVAMLTVATVDQHYFGRVTWVLMTYDVAATIALAALLWPKGRATRSRAHFHWWSVAAVTDQVSAKGD
jgi:hypothetical protein